MRSEMKNAIMSVIAVALVLSFAGCKYPAPLTEEHTIAIDPSIIGLWEEVPEGNSVPDPNGRMLVLKYSDTEYLVHYPTGKDGEYFRAYPIKIGGVSCIQIQAIGKAGRDIGKEEKKYDVISYSLSNNEVEIKTLNTYVIDENIKDSAGLKEAFMKNRDNKDLFANPGRFRRVREKN